MSGGRACRGARGMGTLHWRRGLYDLLCILSTHHRRYLPVEGLLSTGDSRVNSSRPADGAGNVRTAKRQKGGRRKQHRSIRVLPFRDVSRYTYRLASLHGQTKGGAPHDRDIGYATRRRDAPDFMNRHLQAWQPGFSLHCVGIWSGNEANMQFGCDCQPPCLPT
jgi:hypothetical protein